MNTQSFDSRAAIWLLLFGLGGCASSDPGRDGVELGAEMFGDGAESAVLQVSVEGVENERGQLLVALFRSKSGFPNDQTQAAAQANLEPRVGANSVRFDAVPPGPFAMAVFHDEDADFELDTSWLGIPTERWGVSKDAEGWLGPPKFSQAELLVEPGETLEVRVVLGK